jgi:protein-S-isoprenylcysteine O-methyltransferase Ste14
MNETIFRIIFSALWLIFFGNLIWVRYSSRVAAGKPSTESAPHQERRWHIIALALFAPLWFGGIILCALIPRWIKFLSIPLPSWLRLAMAVVAVYSIPFTIWGYRTLGKNWVHALEPSKFIERKGESLVTNGPYRYVRNPIYLGAFTFIIALALVAANWLLLVPDIFIIVVIYLQIDGEEKMLLAKFGDEYREYMKRTPRLIPTLKHGK